MDNINDILASKRDWRKAERRREDRRCKDGTAADRQNLADALRFDRHRDRTSPLYYCHCMHCEHLRVKAWPWWKQVWKGIFPIMIVFMLSGPAQAMTASWYSVDSLKKEGTWKYSHGRMANGKEFKDEAFTCASRLWRIGTTLRVTNLENNESVIVKVTDKIGKRFAHKRIDLSKAAFAQIADLRDGVIKIKIFLIQ